MKKYTARPYQQLIEHHIIDNVRGAEWVPMGMGKTVSVLNAIDSLSVINEDPVLVLAPLRVAASTWPDEVAKWEHLKSLTVRPVVGNLKQRTEALKQDVRIYTTNYENIPWLVDQFGDKWPFSTVVADESTRLKSFRTRQGGKRAKALARVAHQTERFIELTGTPVPNGLKDLWGQVWFLDRGERLGRSYTAFMSRWFQATRVGKSAQAFTYSPLPHAHAEIQDKLRDLCLTLDVRDWFDLKEPIVSTVRVRIPEKARRLYQDMEREMFLNISETDVEALNAASKTIKCLQIANGAIYLDESGKWAEVHDLKLQALESIINEATGMPVIVAYHFKSDLVRLQQAFKNGQVLDQNPQTIRDWNAGKIPILFAHPASAGHGLNLQDGGNILVFFAHWWDLEHYQQIVERIGPTRQIQAGHDRPVFIYHIVAEGTIDELVIERRESKKSVQDILLEAMKHRK